MSELAETSSTTTSTDDAPMAVDTTSTSAADPGDQPSDRWWETPSSEYRAPIAVDPAIFALDADEVGAANNIAEPVADTKHAANENQATVFASVAQHTNQAAPSKSTFADWMKDPLGRGANAPAGTSHPKVASDARDTAPARAAAAAHSSFIAAQSVVDFGDQTVGGRSAKEVSVFNLGPIEANVHVSLEGAPSVTMADAPTRMRPSKDGVAPPIKLVFAPTDESPLQGAIVVGMTWPPGDLASEEKRIEVRGTAHHRGTKTHAERASDEASQRKQQADDASTRDARSKSEQQIRERRSHPELKDHEGHQEELQVLRRQFESRLRNLYARRREGVNTAKDSVGEFERKQAPPPKPSLIETLAWACLDGIGAGLARSVSGLVKGGLEVALRGSHMEIERNDHVYIPPTKVQTPAPAALVGILSEAVRDGAKKLYAAGKGELQGGGGGASAHGAGSNDKDSKDAFFATLNRSLFANVDPIVNDTSEEMQNALIPVANTQPDVAFGIMKAATRALESAAAEAEASQRTSTLDHWVRYLAQTSLGSVEPATPGGETLTDMDLANHTGQEHSANVSDKTAAKTFDGLVDLRFTVNPSNPHEPARLTSAKLHGVRQIVADEIAQQGLLNAGVPIRAVGQNAGTVAPLTVVRDESGSISYTDHMKLSSDEPNWFSQKAGSFKATPEGQREGARMLLEEDLLGGPLTVPLVTDAAK